MNNQTLISPGVVDCACVIHGNLYSWTYVERLYNMLSRHMTSDIRLHVYTESDRSVPAPYIKHCLENWGISGPKKAWWYKMQMFNTEHHAGPLLYFDLDTVIVNNLDWVQQLPLNYFWGVQDFKFLWRPSKHGLNSSMMWWDTRKFDYIWQDFKNQNLSILIKRYPGDQDYLTEIITHKNLRFFNSEQIRSWRWQCVDGGYDFQRRRHITPGLGTVIAENTSVLIFHGNPKPDKINDPVISKHWI